MQPETALGVPSDPFGGIAPVSDAAEPEGSTGEDVAIQAGELSFETGEPHIRLRLQNTGSFTVMTVYADVSLYLDDAKKPAAQAKAEPAFRRAAPPVFTPLKLCFQNRHCRSGRQAV